MIWSSTLFQFYIKISAYRLYKGSVLNADHYASAFVSTKAFKAYQSACKVIVFRRWIVLLLFSWGLLSSSFHKKLISLFALVLLKWNIEALFCIDFTLKSLVTLQCRLFLLKILCTKNHVSRRTCHCVREYRSGTKRSQDESTTSFKKLGPQILVARKNSAAETSDSWNLVKFVAKHPYFPWQM